MTPYNFVQLNLTRFNTFLQNLDTKIFATVSARIALACIVLLGSLFILSSLGFIVHLSINLAYPILATLLSLFALLKNNPKKLISFILYFFIVCVSIILALKYYDPSWDGRAYHQIAIYYLTNGWNPIYQRMADVGVLREFLSHEVWVEHYLKFGEITASNFYLVFGSIESGKAVNYILACSAFFYAISVLVKCKNFTILSATLFAFLLAFSPVVLVQLNTYYIDGLVGSATLIALLSIIDLEIKQNRSKNIIFILSLFILASIKLNGVGYAGFIGVGYFLYKYFFFGLKSTYKPQIKGILGGGQL